MDEQDLVSMDDWPPNEKDMIQLDDGPLALHNFLQPYSIALTNARFDILPLFTHRSHFGSNTLICPDVNFCHTYIPNITQNAQSGKPGMLATAWNQVPGRTFSSNKLGLMFYKIVNCKKCVGVLQQIDESQERKIVLEHCADGMPLLSFMDIKIHENVGPIQLINQHCALPDEDDFNNLLCYFNMKLLAAGQKPNNSHFVAFFNIISMDVSLATTTDMCDFAIKFKIPIHFDANMMAAQMRRKLMVHYQKHCNIHIAAWEGGYCVYTSVMALENIEPSIELPGQRDEQAKDNLSF